MHAEKHKIFSLAAIVVAAVLFGMVISGGLDMTSQVEADRNAESSQPAPPIVGSMVPDFAALADRVIPSVVSVYSTDVTEPGERRQAPMDFFHFFGPRDRQEEQEPTIRRSSGSGFLISGDGELLTNWHVVEHADKIEIQTVDDTRYEVEVVGRDPETDLALLKVIEPDRDFPSLSLGNADSLRVGEWVMAVGNPLNMDFTVTVGVVSAKGRVLGLAETSSFENYIQTDAAINFGNSGGPLVNLRGEVIGINTAINARGQNLGFAVPVDTAKQILPQLRDRGRVVRGYLGVTVQNVDQDVQEAFGLKDRDGAFVVEVLEGHAGYKGGLKKGDVVVEIDGAAITDTRELIDMVSSNPPDTKIHMVVIRNGKRTSLDITLEERLSEGDDEALEERDTDEADATERVGVTISELDQRTRQFYGVESDMDGVVISRVRAVSPAGEKGLIRGDVITEANGAAIASADDLNAVIDEVGAGEILRLYVYRPRAERAFFAILRLEE